MAVRREKVITSRPRERLTIVGTETTAHREDFIDAVRTGLTASSKSIPCRFFYDEKGSQFFEQICELPEYYLTRAEREILQENAREIAETYTEPINLVELGSGSASKTRFLIDAFLKTQGNLRYIPVDISRSILEESSLALVNEYEGLEIHALACEYHEGLRQLEQHPTQRQLILWLGSNIGNLERSGAVTFLGRAREVRP